MSRVDSTIVPTRSVVAFHNRLWGMDPEKNHFVAPVPVSLGRADLNTLREKPYVVAEKSHGERRVLLLGLHAHGDRDVEYAALMDRAMSVETGTTTFDAERLPAAICGKRIRGTVDPFAGTMLDGELLPAEEEEENGERTYVVFDAMFVCGYDVRKQSLEKRMSAARTMIGAAQRWTVGGVPMIPRLKVWHALGDRPLRDILTSGGREDGLVFVPSRAPVRKGRHTSMFKWKRREDHTVDLLWRGGEDLYWGDSARILPVPFAWASQVAASLVGQSPGVYELAPDLVDPRDLAFRVLGARADKSDPNQRRTVEATIENIMENLTLEDLETAIAVET